MVAGIGGLGRRFEMGRVAEQAFDLARQDFGIDFAVAFACGLPPALLSGLLIHGAVGGGVLHRPFGGGFMISGLLGLALSAFSYGFIISGALERLQGRNPTFSLRLAPAVRALPTLIGVVFLGYLGILLGLLLLVVPGMILVTMWVVIAPVAVGETHNVFACFSRSAALTKGCRWRIFLILLIAGFGALLVGLISNLVVHGVLGVRGGNMFASPLMVATGPLVWVALVVQLLVGCAIRVVWATGLAALYHELRSLKGGFDVRRLADVFA